MTVQREAQSTTPSPRNAPPMTDRERLVRLIGRTDTPERIADRLLAEGVTLPEVKPEKAGPVTSEEAAVAFLSEFDRPYSERCISENRHALDAAMPLLARDHGLLTREEVERRARGWMATYTQGCFPINSLLETLLRRGAGGGS